MRFYLRECGASAHHGASGAHCRARRRGKAAEGLLRRSLYIMKHAVFFKHVAIVSAGGLLAKAIGAVYRIPLANLLGGYGLGLYQMAYPLFCLMLTFSSAGVPAALARTVAAERAAGREGSVPGTALRLFALPGFLGTMLMCLLAPAVAGWQGDGGLVGCYFALAPSVFFVALVAVLRGYFQGRSEMLPTAASEVVEQLVKAGVGLLLAARFSDPVSAARAALFGVTMSEFAAFVFLAVRLRGERVVRRDRRLVPRRPADMGILFSALPVMASAALLPLSQMLDSVVVVRLLSRHTESAVSLYGLFAGSAASLISLPATVCYGLVAASVPAVAACCSRGEGEEARRRAVLAVLVTLALAVPCAAGLFVFARPVVALLYPSLTAGEGETLVRLLRLSSVSAATLAGLNTLSACLTGMGRAKRAALAMLAAVSVKFVLQWALVGDPAWSVYGAAVASNACYLVAFFLDLLYTMRKSDERKKVKRYDHDHRIGRRAGRRYGARARGGAGGGQGSRAHADASLGAGADGRGDRI